MFKTVVLAALTIAAGSVSAQITVAAAANVQFAMEELKADFQKRNGGEVKTVYGSSGKLAAQIKHGAPFDVFVSADTDFPDSLVRWGSAVGKPRVYAKGKLVLWTLLDLDLGKGLSLLTDTCVRKIALPDPKTSPYGREALKAMQNAGVWDKVRGKIVYSENIAQASQYILTQTVEIGFNARSIAASPEMQGQGKWVGLDSSSYSPIAQAAVVLKYGRDAHPVLSDKFNAYLYSESAGSIFKKFGYTLP
jgi:molybdate transport system substrate-binding protein